MFILKQFNRFSVLIIANGINICCCFYERNKNVIKITLHIFTSCNYISQLDKIVLLRSIDVHEKLQMCLHMTFLVAMATIQRNGYSVTETYMFQIGSAESK